MRLVCEAVSGYISNMEIYAAKGKKLEDTFLSLSDKLKAAIITFVEAIFITV